MKNNSVIDKIELDCPFCNKIHLVEKFKRTTKGIVKGDIIDYEEELFRCTITNEEENEFVPMYIMDENLLRARDSYRKTKGLLTSCDIAKIRRYYELTQSDFSNLLGWGDVTVTRYESKTIQDETYDNIMKMAYENSLFALNSLEKNKHKFDENRYYKIKNTILKRIEENGIQYLKKQEIYTLYSNYYTKSVFNGYKYLDLEKLATAISFFANNVNHLYKVKLMKLLWYADILNYKEHGVGMFGLVYKHMPYGALPLAYDEIIYLPTVNVEEKVIYDDISYKIIPNESVDLSNLNNKEIDILEMIARKFRDYRSQEIVAYMHKEKAYLETKAFQIISYDLGKELNEF